MLPFFVVFAFLVFVFLEIMFRSVVVSHASFAAARRVGVQSLGGTPASAYVERHYQGGGMRGFAVVDSRPSMGGNPRIQTVGVTDTYSVLLPTGRGTPLVPELREQELRIPHAPARVAGTGPRSFGSDNEL